MSIGSIFGGLLVIIAWAAYLIAYPEYSTKTAQEEYREKNLPIRASLTKIGLILSITCMVLRVAIPTKEDALLIGGVVIGANVAEKTINAASESEMIGKVFEIVEEKVDQTLNDIKGTKNEIPQGRNTSDKN